MNDNISSIQQDQKISQVGVGYSINDLVNDLTVEQKDVKPLTKIALNNPIRFTVPANGFYFLSTDLNPDYIFFQSNSGLDIDVTYGTRFTLSSSFVISDGRLIPIPCPKRIPGLAFRNNNASDADVTVILVNR